MSDVSIPSLPVIAPVTGDSIPLERAATSLVDRRATVDALQSFVLSGINKTTVGLANVDNTADSAKPVSTLQAAAIAAAPGSVSSVASRTGAVTLTAADVGLGNVNNTADSAKPVSTPQAAAIASAANVVVGSTVTATGTLALSALGAVTPVNSASATVQTLPSASTAFAANAYGLVVLSQKGAGAPTFAPAGSDLLRATSGIPASVQYGMIAAQVISSTEWALA
jgi:hypothetical protein